MPLTNRVAKLIIASFQIGLNMPEKWLYAYGIFRTSELYLPDFLCIGAQKAVTTWLFKNLSCHPEIYLPEESVHYDLHYFDSEFHRSLKFYSKKFECGHDLIKGENTPAYGVMSRRKIRFVKKIIPNVRLIFILRNPIERAWSHAKMALLKNTNRNIGEVDESEFYSHFTSERSRKRGNYLTAINNWLSCFPKAQFFIGFFEDIMNRPQSLLIDVFTHIGVSKNVDWEKFPYMEVINKGLNTPIPKKYRIMLEEIYRQEIEILIKNFSGPAKEWKCS